MKRSRIHVRHVLASILLVAGLVLVTALAVLVQSVHRQADLDENARLEACSRLLAARCLATFQTDTPVAPVVASAPDRVRLSILDTKGMTIADSQFSSSAVPSRMTDAAVQQAAANGTGIGTTYRVESERRERIACLAVNSNNVTVAYALASSPSGLTWQSTAVTLSWAVPLFLAACAGCAALALVLARAVMRPVADLADALERRSLDDLASQAMRADSSELGRAQQAGYAILQDSTHLVEHARSQAEMLSAVMDSVSQAIAVVDDTGTILSTNATFDRLFRRDALPPAGRRFAELVALPGCLAAIDRCVTGHQPQSSVVEDRGRSYDCSVHELNAAGAGGGRFIVILDDITEALSLPRIKADFITNASHELKTPLTAIRGYLELLHDEPGNPHYLAVIERNVDRLIALASDISLLSRLENQAPAIELVAMAELERDLADLFAKQARETGVPLEFSVDADGQSLYADRLMLLQLFINLIENAYRFTSTGTITVSSTADSTHVILGVTDTGQGIAAADLPRIFERFYSRSPDHGRQGTGLGLAIVKRIVLAHNGTIDVQSAPGKGTSFVIRIPRNLGPRGPAAFPQQASDTDKEES